MTEQTAISWAPCTHPWATTDVEINSGRPYCQQCGLDWQLVFKAEAAATAPISSQSCDESDAGEEDGKRYS